MPHASSMSQAVGQAVAYRRVPGDLLGEFDAGVDVLTFEEPLDALVDEPQARLHFQNRLTHDRESEVTGLDQTGMHRAHRDLVDTGPLDLNERVGTGVVHHGGRWSGIALIGCQPSGQCW